MTNINMAQPDLITSPIFPIHGQRSRWRYPSELLRPQDATKLRNVSISRYGTGRTRIGYEVLATKAYAPIMGLGEFTFAAHGRRRVIVTTEDIISGLESYEITQLYDTGLLYDDGLVYEGGDVTGTPLTGGVNDFVRMAFLDDQVFITNGIDQVQVWDGDESVVAADITGSPWTAVRELVVHRGVLMALSTTEGGTTWPTLIRWCDLNRQTYAVDTTVWLENNRTFVHEGSAPIVGAVDNWGKLWIFKEDGVFTGTLEMDVGRFEFVFGEEFRGIKLVSQNSLVARPEFIFGATNEGAFAIMRDGSYKLLTQHTEEWYELNRSRLAYSQAWVREREQQVCLLVSTEGNLIGHDLVLVWDWLRDEVWFEKWGHSINTANRTVDGNGLEQDLLGAYSGSLYVTDQASVQDDGIDIESVLELSTNDLGTPGVDKHFNIFRLHLSQRAGRQSIRVALDIDQATFDVRNKIFSSGTKQFYDDGLTYDSGLRYEGGSTEVLDYWVNRVGRNLTPKIYSRDPIEVVGYSVQYQQLEG